MQLQEKYLRAIEASIAASREIMRIYAEDFESYEKEDGSPLTQADLASTKVIHAILSPLEIPITGEETDKIDFETRKNWRECWCVDPLDGTKEFIKKNGEFAVNIALIQDGKSVFGVIASPVWEQVIFGSEETGVFELHFDYLNQPHQWKKIDEPENINLPLRMVSSRSHASASFDLLVNNLKKISPEIEYRQKGSSLKFFDLANGTVDVYPRFAPTMEWDIAAGQIILETLGGKVVEAESGLPLMYNKENLLNPHFIACTKLLINEL